MRDLRAELYTSPEWELRGKDNLAILAECRFLHTPKYREACDDENFWYGLVVTRFIDAHLEIPEEMDWKTYFARLALGENGVLVGLVLPSSPIPALANFDRRARLEEVIRWFMREFGLSSGDLLVTLPSGVQTQIGYENGRIIGGVKANRELSTYIRSEPSYMASFLLEVL